MKRAKEGTIEVLIFVFIVSAGLAFYRTLQYALKPGFDCNGPIRTLTQENCSKECRTVVPIARPSSSSLARTSSRDRLYPSSRCGRNRCQLQQRRRYCSCHPKSGNNYPPRTSGRQVLSLPARGYCKS